MLGYYENGALIYAGRVGTGFTMSTARTLRKQLGASVIRWAAKTTIRLTNHQSVPEQALVAERDVRSRLQ